MNFLREELEWCAFDAEAHDTAEFPVVVTMDDNGYIEVEMPEELKNAPDKYGEPWIYVKDTRRNFVDIGKYDLWLPREHETDTLLLDNFRAAWYCHSEPYLEKARKHNVDIKIITYEQGMQFHQVIEIIGGKIVRDEDIQYDDWDWEAEFPRMGG